MRSLLPLSMMMFVVVAMPVFAQEQPVAAPSLGSSTVDATDRLSSKANELMGKAGEMVGQAGALAGAAMPAELSSAVSDLTGGPAPASGAAISPEFTQGQDKSITVTSEGKPESLFFTPNQLASIMRARAGFLAPREAYDPTNQSENPDTPASHIISLAGIVYVSKNNWVLWLNGERVTRKNMPQRLLGATVRPDRAHLRWMDVSNQRIVNITLKPHQRYLLDSDTIVPALDPVQ